MARTWEDYLFNDHQAVAVSPWRGATGLQLFDVMVRRHDNFFKTGQAGLRQIGSFFGFALRKGDDVENLKLVDKLKEALHNFKYPKSTTKTTSTDDSQEEPIIKRETLPSLRETVSADSRNLASFMEYASVDISSSKAMTFTLEDVSVHCVDREALRAAIDVWKPNMASLTKYTTPSLFRGLVDLFVITDILYAGHVTVANEASRSIGAGVDAGLAGKVLGVEAAANFQAEHSNGFTKDFTGGHIPFAIRVVRLRYTSKGELYFVRPESRSMSDIIRVIAEEPYRESGPEVEFCLSSGVSGEEVYASETIVDSGDASGIVKVSQLVQVVENPPNGAAAEQDEQVARAQAEEDASWLKNNYDPLRAYKCEMDDFFGDDLYDLAGNGSVIPLDIDIEADAHAASEAATVHTKVSDLNLVS